MDFEHTLVYRVTGLAGDPQAIGGAVTMELCGHWEHDGACRWPHHTETVVGGGEWMTTVRFDAPTDEVDSVRSTIIRVLEAGSIMSPDEQRVTWGPRRRGQDA